MPSRRGIAGFVVVALIALTAPVRAGLSERLGVQRLGDELPAGAALVTDPASDAIAALRALDLVIPGADRDPGPASADWIRTRAAAFGLGPDDGLIVEKLERLRDGGSRVLLRQVWRGVPVWGGDARVVLSADGRLRAVASGFRVAIAAPADARVPRESAITRGVGALAVSSSATPASAQLWVRRDADRDRLAWRVEVTLADGRPATCWVDASDGANLSSEEGIAHAVGLVYPVDPRDALAEKALLRLAGGPGLINTAFAVGDQRDPLVTPLGPDGDFRYAPDQAGFDQVNAYWHADWFLHGFLAGLGYPGLTNALTIRVNAPLEPNVALTTGTYVDLGRPITNFSREPARASDIVYHELTHAILYAAGVMPGGTNRESSALHEGLADYLAAACTTDPAVGEWLYIPYPNGVTRVDQPADPWNADHYDQVAFGGVFQGSAWANGMILSGAMWDLRGQIGAACDSLLLESLDYLPTQPTWAQLANALLEANVVRHGDRFGGSIVRALAARKIRGAVALPARIAGPAVLAPGTQGTFTADPCCGIQEVYRWSGRAWCRGAPCGEWRDLADGPVLTTSFEEDTELKLRMSSPWDDEVQTTRFVGVRLPTLDVEGPRRIVANGIGQWTARASGMGPMLIQWQRRWQESGPLYDYIGEGNGMSFVVDRPCDVRVTFVDGLQRVTQQSFSVETFADAPPPEAPAALSVSQRSDARARAIETTVNLPRSGPLRMRVYDVRGRERARLFDGVANRGTRIVRWDAGALEPGLYLLRVESEPAGMVYRFTILR